MSRRFRSRLGRRLLILAALALTPGIAIAQTGPTPAGPKARPDPYGSPLDTLMSTRLWTDVPPAQDFVKTTRPDAASVDYTPLTGARDPERPKPRDPAGVAALQAELEAGGAKNDAMAKGLYPKVKAAETRRVRTPAPRKTSAASAQ